MQFDIIVVDPPYHESLEEDVLQAIRDADILAEDGYVIVEADLHTDFAFAKGLGYHIISERNYKTNKHVFLAKDA